MHPYCFDSIIDNIRTQLAKSPPPTAVHIASNHTAVETSRLLQTLYKRPVRAKQPSASKLRQGTVDMIADLAYDEVHEAAAKIVNYTLALKADGYLILAVKSQAGLQRLGSRQAESPTMHQLDTQLRAAGLAPVFREYVGKFSTHNSLAGSRGRLASWIETTLNKFGRRLPSSQLYSPVILFIYQNRPASGPYVSRLSFRHRAARVRERTVYKIRNHKINDYIVATELGLKAFARFVRNISFISRYRLQQEMINPIELRPKSSGKLRVAIAMTWLEMGGVERVVLNIIKDLDRSKYEIVILTTHFSRNPWHAKFEEYSDEIVHIPQLLGEEYMERYESIYLREYLAKQKIDVLLITNSMAAYKALPGLKRRLPNSRVYDLLHTHGTPADNDAYLRISMPYIRHITKRVVINEYLKIYYCDKYPVDPNDILVIYNGIDQTARKKPVNTERGREIIQKQAGERAIVYLGRLEVDKSPMRLVHIAAGLKKAAADNPAARNAYIAVCGDGILRHDMEKEAERLNVLGNQIRFCGYVEATNDAVAAADFTILTSDSEGIPMSMLESLQFGTPAIGPSVGGIPEIIDNKISGFLVAIKQLPDEKAKINAFCRACSEALAISQDKYCAMQAAGKQRVIERFGHMASDYMQLFDGKLDNPQ